MKKDNYRPMSEVSKRVFKAVTQIRKIKGQITDEHVENICLENDVCEKTIRLIWGFPKGQNPNFRNGQNRKKKRTGLEMQSRCANFEMKHTSQRCNKQCNYCKIRYAKK